MLMTCRHVAQLRDVYHDGELSPSLVAEVHAHLLQCPACQEQFEVVRACGAVIAKDHSGPELDSGFASRVVAELAMERADGPSTTLPTRRDARRRIGRWVLSSTLPAAAAMLFFAVLIWPSNEPARQNTDVAGVAVTATDGMALNDALAPALDAVGETTRTADNIRDFVRRSVDEAQLRQSAEGGDKAPEPELTLLDAFLQPFRDVLEPVDKEKTKPAEESEVVRF